MVFEIIIKEQLEFDKWHTLDGKSEEIATKKKCTGHILSDNPFTVGSVIEIKTVMQISKVDSSLVSFDGTFDTASKLKRIYKAELIGSSFMMDMSSLFASDSQYIKNKIKLEQKLVKQQIMLANPPIYLSPEEINTMKEIIETSISKTEPEKEKTKNLNRFTGFVNDFEE